MLAWHSAKQKWPSTRRNQHVNPPLALAIPDDALRMLVESVADRVLERLGHEVEAPATSPWCDYKGAAEHLACAPKRIRNLTAARRIPHHREGGRVIYHKGELDRWILEGTAEL